MKGISTNYATTLQNTTLQKGLSETGRRHLSLNPIVKAMQRMGNAPERPLLSIPSPSGYLIKQQSFHGRFLQNAQAVSKRPATMLTSAKSYSSVGYLETMLNEDVIMVPNPALEVQAWLETVKDSVSLHQVVAGIKNSSHFQSTDYQQMVRSQTKEMAKSIEQRMLSVEAEKNKLAQEDAKVTDMLKQISDYRLQLSCLHALADYIEDPTNASLPPLRTNL